MEEQKRLGEERARIRLAADAQIREQASMDAARAFDVQDFVHKVGQICESKKNRWVAMQRVLLLSKALPHASMRTLARDWGKWDSTNLHDLFHYPTPESYAIKYKTWLQKLLAHLAAGRNRAVELWWAQEIATKVPPADLLLPALPPELLTEATHLVGAAPAPSE